MSQPRDIFLKIIVIGDTQTGKTSLIKRLARDFFHSCDETSIIDDYRIRSTSKHLEIDKGVDALLQLRNISRHKSFQCSVPCALVIVYDVNNEESFKSVEKWKSIFFEGIDLNKHLKKSIQVLTLANKCDLEKNDDFEKALSLTLAYCKSHEKQWNILIKTNSCFSLDEHSV